ncbi:MAG: MerR family transcriptional regulator [Alphaproteobacteria bacterium]
MYTIKDVSKKMNISEHTLRFWDKTGLFPFVSRDKNNIRIFSDNDLRWIYIVKCLKNAGTDNKSIKKYIDLCIIGDSTIRERYEIIKITKAKAEAKMKELQKQMEVICKKEDYYKNMIENKETDKLNPINLKNNFNQFLETCILDNNF